MNSLQERQAVNDSAIQLEAPRTSAFGKAGRPRDTASVDSLEAVLDAFAALLCVVDDGRRVLYMNHAARNCVDRHDGFMLREGCLYGVRAETTHRLDRALKAVRDQRAAQDAFQVQGMDRETTLQVSVSALANAAAGPRRSRGGRTALLTASRVRGSDHDEKTLRRLFGLSKSEAALLKGLLAGKTVEQCAQARGIATSTARSQLSSIFCKTNTTHQSQLIAVAKALPATVVGREDYPWGDGWFMV